ncbi:PAS domain-containing protein [Calothrix sp. PCC 7507]|uniref:PAS domain-containing protein n=1 Tax=Calothrix sp. PCC 7507 TaxID=99598 RepID=UPI00029F190C|nr:PAS domain-containing protein [Calothrix sp. PCC 7507]AFY34286.1 multi-sensor signal transduction histidine kinase [Calothrix sp. PCC 7507]
MTQQDSALILVVDDDDLTRIHLCDLMEEAGYQVAEASNGSEAIATCIRLKPDLVLLDALMPVMDGFTCCAELQKLPNADTTPIVMITALYDQASVTAAFAVGATDLITKPIQWPVLSQRVRRLLEANRTMQELRQQTEAAKRREAQLQIALEAAQMGAWDWDITTNKVTWSDHKAALLGLEKDAFDGTYEGFIRSIHPQDRDFVNYSVMQAIEAGAEYDIEFRAVLPDGSIRWLVSKGVVWRDASGVAVRMSGVDMDITKRKQAAEKLESYAQQQAIVAELSQIALADTDLSRLMNLCVTLVAQCLKIHSCQVLELLPDGNTLMLKAEVGWQQEPVNNVAFSTRFSPEPILSENLYTEKLFLETSLLDDQQRMGNVSVVIHGKEIPFGVLRAHTNKKSTFTKDDIYFLQAVANVLATAIERHRVEEALKKSEERFQIVARATNDAVWDWDLLTYQVWWNLAVEKLFGYSTAEVNSNPYWWLENLHPDDKYRIATHMRAVIDSGEKFWSNEYRFRRSDGSYAEIFDRGYVVHDDTGKPVRMIGGMVDITESKRAQAELERQNWRSQLFADVTLKIRQSLRIEEILPTSVTEVQQLLHADRVLILRLKSDGSFIVVEEAVVLGLPVLLGQHIIDPCFWEKYIEKYRQGNICVINDIYQTDIQPCHIELLAKFAVRANLVVPIFRQNQLWGLLITHQCTHSREWTDWEIQLLRQLADQIGIALAQSYILEQETRQRKELTRSNEELQQFAFIASHDLQEPLRKIKTFGERLKATCGATLTEQGLDYLERMQNAAERMETLIEDLLKLSRVTTKAQAFVPVDLAQITKEVLSDLEVRIQQTRGHVEVGELPIIKADPLQMRQLLQNLIGNALKFHCQQVPPVVKIYSQLLNNQLDKVVISSELCQIIVEDNGIGFEEKYLDRIFNVFQRLHSRRDYEGTGMGLAICRKIAEIHHGSITAESTLGKGTRFIVTLPVN